MQTLNLGSQDVELGRRNGVDTTFLLEELKRKYRAGSGALEISFRELVSWVKPGDQMTHQIHPYPAKLLPHIAHFFTHASALRRESTHVLDPFVGSGTVALEASLAGAIPQVADCNPLALLVTKVKTTPYLTEALVERARILNQRINRLRTAPSVAVLNESIWYLPSTKQGLERVLRAVMEVEDPELCDFFRVCFSVVARRLSLADPSISVPVRLGPKSRLPEATNRSIREHLKWVKNASPAEEFSKVVQANVARVQATNSAYRNRARCVVVGQDARNLLSTQGRQLASNSVHLTITSPPYGSAQKYIRSSSLSLNWLSMCTPDELANLEGGLIGREHLPARLSAPRGALSASALKFLEPTLLQIRDRNPHRAAITETYLLELTDALTEIGRVTAPGGHIVLVVGNNTVAGLPVANDEVIATVLGELGLTLELRLQDRIHSRGLLTARHASASLINGETILLFRK